jgi:pimeloyl-ACP methyl ester carboxylesterase
MPKAQMRDLVVLLPGITGSVLRQHEGDTVRDVWAFSGPVIWSAITDLHGLLDRLTVHTPDPHPDALEGMSDAALDDLGDGIRATGLMPDLHVIPGLWKIDGYSQARELILNEFDVTEGQNYFEFSYDWRRDNRIAAHRLKRLLDVKLGAWRASSGARDAKVILVAHSMGGLVSRYYLECLEGWRDCRALVTFGTPYRGALKALDVISNGLKVLFADLSGFARSTASIHQLLPTFRCVRVVDGLEHQDFRLDDPNLSVPNLDATKFQAAARFHQQIASSVKAHLEDAEYVRSMRVVPIVGTRQPTLVSARLENGKLTASEEMLKADDADLAGGDGTVPRIAAIPEESWGKLTDVFHVGQHGSLQAMDGPLEQLRNILYETQHHELPVQGETRGLAVRAGWISTNIADLFASDQSILLRARAFASDGSPNPVRLEAWLRRTAIGSRAIRLPFTGDPEHWQELRPDHLDPGVYRVTIKAQGNVGGLQAIQDAFEVAH